MKYYYKKLISLAMFLMAVIPLSAWEYPTEPWQELPYREGMGTKEAPYIITNAQHLATLAYNVNKGVSYEGQYFKLANDIDLNPGFTFKRDGYEGDGLPKEWMPIGRSADKSFQGYFDGGGYTVRGLYISEQSITDDIVDRYWDAYQLFGGIYMGLFGYAKNGYMQNITVNNSLINIEKEFLNDDGIRYIWNVGTIGGRFDDCNVSNVTSDCNVTVKTSTNLASVHVAGIVGLTSFTLGGHYLKQCQTN